MGVSYILVFLKKFNEYVYIFFELNSCSISYIKWRLYIIKFHTDINTKFIIYTGTWLPEFTINIEVHWNSL